MIPFFSLVFLIAHNISLQPQKIIIIIFFIFMYPKWNPTCYYFCRILECEKKNGKKN